MSAGGGLTIFPRRITRMPWAVVGQGYILRQRHTRGDWLTFKYTQGASHSQDSALGVGISGYGFNARRVPRHNSRARVVPLASMPSAANASNSHGQEPVWTFLIRREHERWAREDEARTFEHRRRGPATNSCNRRVDRMDQRSSRYLSRPGDQ